MSQTSPPPSPPVAPPPPRRAPLRRTHGGFGGVAGGLGRYFDIDPLLIRIAMVVLAIVSAGAMVAVYIACVVLIPRDGDLRSPAENFVDRHGRALAWLVGIVLTIAVISATGFLGWGSHHTPWGPLIVVGIVAAFFIARSDRRRVDGFAPPQAGPTPWTDPGYGPQSPPPPIPWAPYATSAYATTATPAYAAQSPTGAPPVAPYGAPPPPPPAVPPRERSALGPLTFGAALLTGGVLVALDRGDVANVPTVVVLASVLAVVAAGLLVGSVFGRSRGLIVLGVLLSVATAVAGVVHLPGDGNLGDQRWAPVAASLVQPHYAWGMGEVALDLKDVSSTTTVTTSAELGVGELVVTVPDDAVVRLHAKAGIGGITTVDVNGVETSVGGVSREVTTTLYPAPLDATSTQQPTTFDLDLSVGIGHVEVDRA